MRAPDPPDFDLYETLEVSPHASAETIDAAWKVLLRKHHPDLGGRGTGEDAAKRINVAHDWLMDPTLRARYDATRPLGAPSRPREPSFQPPTFQPPPPAARGAGGGYPPSAPPRSSAAGAAPAARDAPQVAVPSDAPRAATVRPRRGIPRGTGFVVAILIGMLAGLLALAPLVFGPRADESRSPTPSVRRSVTPRPSTPRTTPRTREPGATFTTGGHVTVWLPAA